MSDSFNPQERIYDLYSFDVPYDLEPTGLSPGFGYYAGVLTRDKNSAPANTENQEDDQEVFDLTFEEAGTKQHFSQFPSGLFSEHEQTKDEQTKPSAALGATLSQRKDLLTQRLKELIADIRKRERLEAEMLEKADMECVNVEHLLDRVKYFSPGNYPSVDGRRTNLEREIITLKKVGWDERLRCWRDLVMLKKELREALEEYHLILSAEGL